MRETRDRAENAAGMFRLTNKVFVSQPNVIYDVIRHIVVVSSQGCRKIGRYMVALDTRDVSSSMY